jgi:hypothetical protein
MTISLGADTAVKSPIHYNAAGLLEVLIVTSRERMPFPPWDRYAMQGKPLARHSFLIFIAAALILS